MVRLGVQVLPEYVKNESDFKDVLAITIDRRFYWQITNGKFSIRERGWDDNPRQIKVYTGRGGYNLFQQAMKKKLNQQK